MYFVYVLWSESLKKRYVGQTIDINRRIQEHNAGLNGWSQRGIPWQLIHLETYSTRSDAMMRERFLKTGKGRDSLKNIRLGGLVRL